MPAPTADLVCLQCGTVASRAGAQMCRRCGLRFGEAPPAFARLASCPVCYRTTDDDGRLASLAQPGFRVDINAHIDEHERFPVGDDDWLETLRVNDRIRIGRWNAPFDLVRRYLVTGVVDAGRNRLAQHNAHRHGDDPDPALGPRAEHLRRPGGVARRARCRRRAHGPLPRTGTGQPYWLGRHG